MYLETLEKLDIELTNTCNLKCPYCLKVKPSLKEFVKNFQELDYEVLTSFITKLKKYKLKEVILMGSLSEPTLYPKFLDLIRFLKGLNLTIHISSNANTHNEEWWKGLATLLTCKDSIIFSVDGSTQQIYKKYRIGGDLEKVKKHFQAFCSVQKENYSEVYLQTIDFPWYNCDEEYEKIKELFDSNKEYKFQRSYIKNYFPEKESGKLAKAEVFFRKNIESKIKSGTSPKPDCYVLKNKNLYMTYLGDIIPCGVVYEKYLFGSERKEGKIPNIYEINIDSSETFSQDFILKFNSFFKEHFTQTIFKNYECLRRCTKLYSNMFYIRNPKEEDT